MKITINKNQWEGIGRQAGWIKKEAQPTPQQKPPIQPQQNQGNQKFSLSNYFKQMGYNPIINGNTITVNGIVFEVIVNTSVVLVNKKYQIPFQNFNAPNVQNWIKQILSSQQTKSNQPQNQQNIQSNDKITKLFFESLDKQLKNGKLSQKTVDAMKKQVNDGTQTKQSMLSNILSSVYSSIRSVDNNEYLNLVQQKKMPHDFNIEDFSGKSDSNIEAKNENGWHYRLPINRRQMGWSSGNKSIDRVSITAVADPNFIKEMDAFIMKHKAYYKVPNDSGNWLERHDTATVYFIEPVSSQIVSELNTIVSKYSRNKYISKDVLTGQKLGDGFSLEKSPTKDELSQLIQQASTIIPEAGEAIRTFFAVAGKSRDDIKGSSGGVAAVKKFIEMIKI